ncbi:MAG: hypothetical protein NC548_22685 [Lachnospiraceae bacterium]|nr:hypothetical protein [Lachnospiraceae bacterium]
MATIVTQGDRTQPYVSELVADDETDLKTINTASLQPGSTCFVIASSSVYMLNSKREWKQI